ncbi:MAG: DNA cytosine methyltransferase [Dehalobacter sp.]|nr:DNA cytosine methyltransferase [Dehalobacter sp.]
MRSVREIIVDNFAGGGGASTGIALAIGRSVDVAINHDPVAIAMHMTNHPDTEHFCENVWDVDPRKAAAGRPVALVWLSPDCKHFSKAKGGKPVEKAIRGLAWVAVRWAATVKPRVIILENVEEFKTWGPLLKDGRPDPKQKGRTFQAFLNALERQGYKYDHRELRACDYGAPTIRKRLFLVARCDGRPIVWPQPTHGDPNSAEVKSGKLKPWRTAAEIIDWSLPCPSIFKRKRPLAENTMRRIARGIQKFVIDTPNPFIVRIGQTGFGGDRMQYQAEQPLTTVTTKAEHLLVAPVIARQFGKSIGHSTDEPLGTVTAGGGGKSQLVAAFLAQYHKETANHEVRGQVLNKPLLTLDTSNRYALVSSHLVKLRGTCQHGQAVTEPVHTITAGGLHIGEVRAFLMKYYGAGTGQTLDEPLGTITTRDRFGLVTIHGQDYQIIDIGMRMLEPHELFAAQGFPATYIIDHDYQGNRLSKAAQVAMCGNSVPPDLAEALTRVNLPEMCAAAGTIEHIV